MFLPFLPLLLAPTVLGSPGDDLDEFHNCRYQCEQIACLGNPYHIVQEEFREILQKKNFEFRPYEPSWQFEAKLPLYLRLLQWDCNSNCDYQCQQIVTKERVANNDEIYQFHGKWPFLRVLGIQELTSVVFSICNFVPHYIGFRKVREIMRENGKKKGHLNPMYRNILFVSVVTMCAWMFSTIFHIRDFVVTERLDYYFAGLTVLSGFYAIGYRHFKLYMPANFWKRWLFTLACIAAYAGHIYRLTTDWLYTYNMQANVVVGIAQNIVWGMSCFALYTKYYDQEHAESVVDVSHLNYIDPNRIILGSFYSKSPKLYSLYPLMLCFVVLLGLLFEIFDFPPVFYDLVDAHSLWHLVTIFPAFLGWYDWMIWDINENVWDDMAGLVEKKEQ